MFGTWGDTIRALLPLGVTGNTPDFGSGESWFEPRRGNSRDPCFDIEAGVFRCETRRRCVLRPLRAVSAGHAAIAPSTAASSARRDTPSRARIARPWITVA